MYAAEARKADDASNTTLWIPNPPLWIGRLACTQAMSHRGCRQTWPDWGGQCTGRILNCLGSRGYLCGQDERQHTLIRACGPWWDLWEEAPQAGKHSHHRFIEQLQWTCQKPEESGGRGYSVDILWIFCGYYVDILWIFFGYSVDILWIFCGYSVDILWIFCENFVNNGFRNLTSWAPAMDILRELLVCFC